MKYEITVRKLDESEIETKECYEAEAEADDETYVSHLDALAEDIKNNDLVNNASRVGNVITIKSDHSDEGLKESLKELFIREFCFVKFVNIEEIT